MRFLLPVTAAVLLCSGLARAEEAAPSISLDRTIAIDTVIQRNMDGVQKALLKFGADGTLKPVSIILDSPGGSVVTGFSFVNAMEEVKARGVRIDCYVNSMAASMAFQILVHCDNRFALSRSLLLWHRVRTGGPNIVTSPVAANLHVMLQAIDDIIWGELKEALGKDLDDDTLSYHFEQETLHIGDNLGKMAPSFITIKRSFPGLTEALASDKVEKNSKRDLSEFLFGNDTSGGIQYISPYLSK